MTRGHSAQSLGGSKRGRLPARRCTSTTWAVTCDSVPLVPFLSNAVSIVRLHCPLGTTGAAAVGQTLGMARRPMTPSVCYALLFLDGRQKALKLLIFDIDDMFLGWVFAAFNLLAILLERLCSCLKKVGVGDRMARIVAQVGAE